MRTCAMQLIVVLFFLHATNAVSSIAATAPELDQLVGQPADIAPSTISTGPIASRKRTRRKAGWHSCITPTCR